MRAASSEPWTSYGPLYTAITTGFCGSLTTFSSWQLDVFTSWLNPTHAHRDWFRDVSPSSPSRTALTLFLGHRWTWKDHLHHRHLSNSRDLRCTPCNRVRTLYPTPSSTVSMAALHVHHHLCFNLCRCLSCLLSHVAGSPAPSNSGYLVLLPWHADSLHPFHQSQPLVEAISPWHIHRKLHWDSPHRCIPCLAKHKGSSVAECLRGPAGTDRRLLRLSHNR